MSTIYFEKLILENLMAEVLGLILKFLKIIMKLRISRYQLDGHSENPGNSSAHFTQGQFHSNEP